MMKNELTPTEIAESVENAFPSYSDVHRLGMHIRVLEARIAEYHALLAAAEQRATESAALVREIAASDPWILVDDEVNKCVHCGQSCTWNEKEKRWDYEAEEEHLPDCHWLRARAIVERLEGA